MADKARPPDDPDVAPIAPPELRFLRRHLLASLCAIAAVVLGSAWLVGLVGRGPLLGSAVLLAVAMTGEGIQALLLRARRSLWRLSRKLMVSYLLIAVVPAALLTVFFALFAYLATGQFVALVAWRHIGELRREVEEAAAELAVELADSLQVAPSVDLVRLGPSPPSRRRDVLAGIARRFESVYARAVVLSGPAGEEEAMVPADFDDWPAGVRARPPSWLRESQFDARPVVVASGGLELKAASVIDRPPFRVYVEVGLPLEDGALSVLERYTGIDLRIVEVKTGARALLARSPQPGDGASSLLGRLPVLGVLFLEPWDWDSGGESGRGLLMVSEVSLGELLSELFGLRTESGLLIVSVLLLVLLLFVLFHAASLVVGVGLARSITIAVDQLFFGTQRIERGEFQHRVRPRTDDQLGALTMAFNRMARSVGRLVRESTERERLEEELRIGRRIQQSLLPADRWQGDRFEMAAASVPAKEVGGDYYDFFELGGERLGVLIADVSGKGTEAAFYMAEVKGLMMALTRAHDDPGAVLTRANELLADGLDRRTFVTMAYAVLDLATGRLDFGRAGHSPLLYLAAASTEVESLQPRGLSLGLDRHGGFAKLLEARSLVLGSGDMVLLYTDGVTETIAEDGSFYGPERLDEALIAARGCSAREARDRILEDLRTFAGAAASHDDMTLIVLRAK